ncbi:hypothetical protein BaRGS_00001684, partial [Batillaria attramentaria]
VRIVRRNPSPVAPSTSLARGRLVRTRPVIPAQLVRGLGAHSTQSLPVDSLIGGFARALPTAERRVACGSGGVQSGWFAYFRPNRVTKRLQFLQTPERPPPTTTTSAVPLKKRVERHLAGNRGISPSIKRHSTRDARVSICSNNSNGKECTQAPHISVSLFRNPVGSDIAVSKLHERPPAADFKATRQDL